MLLQPKKTKYKKYKKRFIKQQYIETKSNVLAHGDIGLKLLESVKLSSKQLESLRRLITRELNRKGKLWIRIFPSIPVSAKPSENRMGKGKGSISFWVTPVKSGQIIFELSGINKKLAYTALKKTFLKLPVPAKIVYR